MVHPDDRDVVARTMGRSGRTGEPWTMHYRMIRSDGRVIWVLDTGGMLKRDSLGDRGVPGHPPRCDRGAKRRRPASKRPSGTSGWRSRGRWRSPGPRRSIPRRDSSATPTSALRRSTSSATRRRSSSSSASTSPGWSIPTIGRACRETVARSDHTGIWEDTYRIVRRDGGIRWLHSFGRRVSPPGVVPEVWHGVAVDVTASHAEQETPSETRLSQEADRDERSSVEDTAR